MSQSLQPTTQQTCYGTESSWHTHRHLQGCGKRGQRFVAPRTKLPLQAADTSQVSTQNRKEGPSDRTCSCQAGTRGMLMSAPSSEVTPNLLLSLSLSPERRPSR
eukprot:2576418-Amphidinium_carterae.1